MITESVTFESVPAMGTMGRRSFLLAGLVLGLGTRHASAATHHPDTVRLPASATLQYVVAARYRGLPLQTDATLVWQHDAARYHTEWVVRVPLLGERTQRSDGAITAAGLRPLEYVEQTNKRRSAHFDYDGERIRFSDGRDDAPLESGAQDRLTVSVQLGALLAADPDRYPVGSTLTLPVVGVRSAESWHWDVKARTEVVVADRSLPTIKLVRRPRKDPDSQIAVWLAPELHYLPARLRVEQENGDVVDQQLSALPGESPPR